MSAPRASTCSTLSKPASAGSAPTTSTSTSCTASTRLTPVEETLSTLDDLVRAGKIRYIGCSNFSGWHLMKSLAVADRYGWPRYVAHQAYYSLVGRDYEWELMPLGTRSERRHGRLEPARLGPPDRQNPPRPAAAQRQPPAKQTASISARRSPTNISTKSSMRSTKSPKRPARPSRRSRSTGCCSARPSPTSSSARATKSSSGKTSRRRLEADARANRQARRSQRPHAGLSVLAPAPVRRAQSAASPVEFMRSCIVAALGPVRLSAL